MGNSYLERICNEVDVFCPMTDGSTGDTWSVSLYLSLVVSLTALVILVVVLLNCVTCCKEREINFKVRFLFSMHLHCQNSTGVTAKGNSNLIKIANFRLTNFSYKF